MNNAIEKPKHFDPDGAAWSEQTCATVIAALQAHLDYLRSNGRPRNAAKARRDALLKVLGVDGRRVLEMFVGSAGAHFYQRVA